MGPAEDGLLRPLRWLILGLNEQPTHARASERQTAIGRSDRRQRTSGRSPTKEWAIAGRQAPQRESRCEDAKIRQGQGEISGMHGASRESCLCTGPSSSERADSSWRRCISCRFCFFHSITRSVKSRCSYVRDDTPYLPTRTRGSSGVRQAARTCGTTPPHDLPNAP